MQAKTKKVVVAVAIGAAAVVVGLGGSFFLKVRRYEQMRKSPPPKPKVANRVTDIAFEVDRRFFPGGSGFTAQVGKRVVLITAANLVGPQGVLPTPLSAKQIDKQLTSVGFALGKSKVAVAVKRVPLPGTSTLGESASGPGDVLAFRSAHDNLLGKPLAIRKTPLSFPAHVYILHPRLPKGYLHGLALNITDGVLVVSPDKTPTMDGMTGAPVVDETGALVGIHVGGNGDELVSTPASRFLPALTQAVRKSTAPPKKK